MATLIERIKGDFHDLVFEVDLTDYNKTNDDVHDITFSIKADEKDADDSIFVKTLLNSEIEFTGTTILSVNVQWPHDEYDNFIIDKPYKSGLFVTFTDDPAADERVNTLFDVKIIQDFLRA